MLYENSHSHLCHVRICIGACGSRRKGHGAVATRSARVPERRVFLIWRAGPFRDKGPLEAARSVFPASPIGHTQPNSQCCNTHPCRTCMYVNGRTNTAPLAGNGLALRNSARAAVARYARRYWWTAEDGTRKSAHPMVHWSRPGAQRELGGGVGWAIRCFSTSRCWRGGARREGDRDKGWGAALLFGRYGKTDNALHCF
ncbi:hypothetical protein CALCODRAFT_250072 [Calocera cornea HHB12733]|uniref:Uncharacterized protein n=1 Tax=Calocera cornea HHB12733 TaxID=1353952 RepID=A0A165JWU5_9BASI|nr:hypothetical protein CALCODRAFT_250072 [Calocera cornea HHB12733]